MKYLFALLLLVSVEITQCLGAHPIIIYPPTTEQIHIGNNAYICIDTNHVFTIQDVLSNKMGNTYPASMPNLGLSSNVYWATFFFVNTSTENVILKFNQPLLNEVTLYRADGKTVSAISYSENQVFSSRKYAYAPYAFDMQAGTGDTITYVLRFSSTKPIIFDVNIATEPLIIREELQQEVIAGIFIGIIFVMFFYNLFIYFTVLDPSYLAYVCYIICIGLTQITIPGYGFKYLWPNAPGFNDPSILVFASLAAIFGSQFIKQFLKTREHVPILQAMFSVFEILFITIPVIHFTGNKLLAFSLLQLLTFALCIAMIVTAIKIIYIGYRPAIFFLTAWLVLLISACIFIGKDFDLVPYNFLTAHIMQIGSAVEVILLSFALADKINVLKKEKESSQAQAVDALLQNKTILTNQNIILERKVGERTKEIENKNNELYKALGELKKAQTYLVNTEKIASMTQAEVQQEKDTSMNFIVSRAGPLKKDLDDISRLLDKYDMVPPAVPAEQKSVKTDPFHHQNNFASITQMEQQPDAIENLSSKQKAVVKGLRISSELDIRDIKKTSVTETIHAILTHLNPETAHSILLIKKFSTLPEIDCFPATLNQALTTFLTSSIYSISEKKHLPHKGVLTIRTHCDTDNIYIHITDTGMGMTAEVKGKFFEPFFTINHTGSGLDMFAAFSIISDHNGTIELITEYGKGTEFILTLPIQYTR